MLNRHFLEVALEEAILSKNESAALNLIELIQNSKDASLDNLNSKKQSFLHLAYKVNSESIIKILMYVQKDDISNFLFRTDTSDYSCFDYAVINGNDQKALYMLELADNLPDWQTDYQFYLNVHIQSKTTLHLATKYQRYIVLETLLNKICKNSDPLRMMEIVNWPNKEGESPLLWAVKDEIPNIEIIALLLTYGASMFTSSYKHEKPLDYIAKWNKLNQIYLYSTLSLVKTPSQNNLVKYSKERQKEWGAVYKNLVQFQELEKKWMIFYQGHEDSSNHLSRQCLDVLDYILFLTYALFVNDSEVTREDFEREKTNFMNSRTFIRNKPKSEANLHSQLLIRALDIEDHDVQLEIFSCYEKDFENLTASMHAIIQIFNRLKSQPDITDEGRNKAKAAFTLLFLFALTINGLAAYATLDSVKSRDSGLSITLLAITSLASGYLSFYSLFAMIISVFELNDRVYKYKIEAMGQYFSHLYLPDDYKKILHDLNENILQPLIGIEDNTNLPTSADTVHQLKSHIDEQLAQKNKYSIHDIRMKITALYLVLKQLRHDMQQSRKSISFFRPKDEVRISLNKNQPEEHKRLINRRG